MLARSAHKALLLTFILIMGSFLPVLCIPLAHAETTQGYTTLYFTDALNFLENGGDSDFFASLTQTPPTTLNDSQYPPSIFAKNAKRGENNTFISEQWLTWLMFAWIGQNLGNLSEFNQSDLGDFGGFELFFPGPYRIVEGYTYTGNDSVNIHGDIVYHLYFSDTKKSLKSLTDSVSVALYSMNSVLPIPKLIKNTTVRLIPASLGGIYDQQITLSNVDFTLSPEDSLLVKIEIIPTDKPMPVFNFVDKPIFKKIGQIIVSRWENLTRGPIRKQIGAIIKNVTSVMEESGVNFTSDDIASFLNVMKSSKFIYNSLYHPSSVTIPAKITEEDIRNYFLHVGQGMDETPPATDTKNGKVKLTTTPLLWTSPQLDRNKIVKIDNITASIYLDKVDIFRLLNFIRSNITIIAAIYDGNTTIATSEKRLDKPFLKYLQKSHNPLTFTFSGDDREITYGHTLGLSLSLNKKLIIHKVSLLYDQVNYPSALRVTFEETQNIQIHDITMIPADGKIIPGETVQYLLNVTSIYSDTIHLSTIQKEKTGTWEVTVPSSATVTAHNWVKIPMSLHSTNTLKEAYGNTINLIVLTTGNTGIARGSISAEVSTDAIQYKVEILGYSDTINISKGENKTFYFIIKNNNTGAIDDVDSYSITASSKNNWPLLPRATIKDLKRGASTEPTAARVVIQAPKNTTASSDVVTITVTSEGNSDAAATITVTVNVVGGGFFDDIFTIFDSAAKSLGLNDIFGSDGAFVLVIMIVVIILFLLIILALVLTIKPARIICTDRIKEIESNEKAVYDLTVQNPQKKQQSYEIYAEQTAPTEKWIIGIQPLSISIDGRSTRPIQITAAPTEHTKPGDWTEISVQVKKTGKKKSVHVTLMATLKEGKTLLHLENVSHWPPEFNPAEKVTTLFSISNNGTITARNVKVFFYLNGRQKHKLTVTIPAGAIADIQIPWIATKGKNQVRIRLKEQ